MWYWWNIKVSVYTVWADIATGSAISLWNPDYCYGLWADETTFAYGAGCLTCQSGKMHHACCLTCQSAKMHCADCLTCQLDKVLCAGCLTCQSGKMHCAGCLICQSGKMYCAGCFICQSGLTCQSGKMGWAGCLLLAKWVKCTVLIFLLVILVKCNVLTV